jgi:ADP-heptose:LPS heptosyltransferase
MQLAVSNNSGPSHMLALGGCNILAVFGPTNAIKSVPFAPHSRFIRPMKGKDIKTVSVDAVEKALLHDVEPQAMHSMGCELGAFIWQNTSARP